MSGDGESSEVTATAVTRESASASLSAALRAEASAVSVSAPYGRPRYVDLMREAAAEIDNLRESLRLMANALTRATAAQSPPESDSGAV